MAWKPLRLAAVASIVASLAVSPAHVAGQTTLDLSVACFVQDCTSLRVEIATGDAPLALNDLTLTFLDASWIFTSALVGPFGPQGTYDAEDSISPFSGFSSISSAGNSLFIDFINDQGFWFELFPLSGGFVQMAANPSSQYVTVGYQATDADGNVLSGTATVTPEPITMMLLGSGLLGVGAAARRRRGTLGDQDRET